MNNTISIRHNFPEVARKLNLLADDVGNKALVRAMNKTIDQGKTQMARNISAEFRITVGTAKERLSVSRASAKGGILRFEATLAATSRGKGRSMNLIHFVTRAARRTKKGMTQLQFQILRSGGRKQLPGAFIATNRNTGGTAVFMRQGKERMPIVVKNTIDVPQMFNARRINESVRKVMLDRFDTNFARELRSVLKGYAR